MIKKTKYIHDFVTGLYLPVIDMNLTSIEVGADIMPLRVQWTPELAQDVAAYHNIDAETELTNLLSEHVAQEINREIIRDLNITEQQRGMTPEPDPIRPRIGRLLTSDEVGNIGLRHQQAIREETVNRWAELGFLEGLNGHVRENVATLLEGQASALINETTQPETDFENVTFPIVRRVFARTLGNDIVATGQPLTPNLMEEVEDYEVNWRTDDTWEYENLYGSLIGVSMELKPYEFIPKPKSSFDII
jgi:hypothetical protein